MLCVEAFKRLGRFQHTRLEPDEIALQGAFRLARVDAHSVRGPRVIGLVILLRAVGRKALAIRILSSEDVGDGLRRSPSVGDEVALAIGFGWVFGTPDMDGGHIAHVDHGPGPDGGR